MASLKGVVRRACIALPIGAVEALGLLGDRYGLRAGVWSVVARLNPDLTGLGAAMVAIFLLSWGISAAVYRRKGYERGIRATSG